MLQIIYGVPGSGKTYYSVYQIKKIQEKRNDIILISNIENLKLSHLDLDALIQKYGGVDKFFNVDCEFWKSELEKKKILFIDEAQRYFNKKFFSSTVFFFFQYHRHLNIDIYLITQSYKILPSELVVLSELVVQAVPSSFRWFNNSFKYLVKDLETFDTVDKIDIPFKKDIASLYTSALVIEKQKKITYTQKYLIISIVIAVISFVSFFFLFPYFLFHSMDNKFSSKSSSSVSNRSGVSSSSVVSSNSPSSPNLQSVDDGFEYPNGIASSGYRQKEISYGEFLNTYRNDVVYDLSVDYIMVYDDNNKVKKVIVFKDDLPSSSDDVSSDSSLSDDAPSDNASEGSFN